MHIMLSLQDCCDFCSLSEDEVAAIAEHEHLPEIAAAGYGQDLLRSAAGTSRIGVFIQDDICLARTHGNPVHARHLERVLSGFERSHPGARRPQG